MRGTFKPVTMAAFCVIMLCGNGYYITPSSNRILPVDVPVGTGVEQTVTRGDIIYRQAVGTAYIATLASDVTISIAGKSTSLPAGSRLSVARVDGDAAKQITGNHGVFCSESQNNWNMAAGVANLATLGLFAAGRRHSAQIRFCLVDTDGDRLVDKAFLAGANRKEDQEPVAITPAAIDVRKDVALPGESEARLRFGGSAGIFGNVAIDLEVVENGQKLAFSNGRTLISKKSLPETVSIFGSSLTVLSYDETTKTANIRLNSGFSPIQYNITTTTTTTYIPMYIPR